MDCKLRNVAKSLKGWAAQRIGSVRFQLAIARVVIYELDIAQESRLLSLEEIELRCDLKAAFLLEVLERLGFPQRWRDSIAAILSSMSTKVLVNGCLERCICHARLTRCCRCCSCWSWRF